MGNILLALPAFLLLITVVVFFHEMGHFLVGRLFRVSIETFSLGFGREVFGWTDRRGTRWKVSWLPLGGYVKFLGDADASSKPDTEALKNLPPAARANALHLKPLWQRALVVAAGPVANFILAIVVLTGVYVADGKPVEPPVIDNIAPHSAAEGVLAVGDLVRSVEGKPVKTFLDIAIPVQDHPGKPLHFVVSRGGIDHDVVVTPAAKTATDPEGDKHVVGVLGIRDRTKPIGLGEGVQLAAERTWFIVEQTVLYIGKMVTGAESTSQLHGPLGILNVSGNVAEYGSIFDYLGLLAGISISIGLLNLFPIPVLDGGHLLYYGCEAVLGRPLGEKAQEVGFRLGLALVLGLMLLATYNDVMRWISS